jgi:SagB-type dehydrogenase family enzyme
MSKKKALISIVIATAFLLCPLTGLSEDLKPIKLVKPQMDSGRMLMHVLKDRKSSRLYSPRKLPIRVLSTLLWSACGVNRPLSGGRTVPSAHKWYVIDVYVATADGLYLYDPLQHILMPIDKQDIRGLTGTQKFVKDVPVNLIYVSNFSRMPDTDNDQKEFYSAVSTGFISQNVYLYCASEGLATVVRATIDRAPLAKAMKLRDDQMIILTQSVGYPKK